MGKCRICGKQTFGDYQYCRQCNSAQKGGRQPERGDRRHYGSTSSYTGRSGNPSSGLNSDYLKDGYFNEKGYLRKEIYTSEAELVAAVLSTKGMTRASLRRFYNKLRGIYSRFKDTRNFEEIKSVLYSFYPNAADAVSKNNNIPVEFRTFINVNVNLAEKDPDHLHGFVEHFQSVIAYFKESGYRR
ncbi:type III-A CRISPR-associated protein Csm2 [Pelotomaculum isophthalicicum JI]|uniref:CRISPR system Cms protein Csm2 n=1 Tax=Pelotomaculum isophthalicicum JI TaxID=947010 RepID=A0A9X4H266_9FIRM|nr:type III-A CRISPR-associated protein Csm2 [Pelotomaculum isophthalicicum]MDF9408706.1 type III-A CRISPR-associated protein Csm2 [Pelotomaculum isophthalicicum JI]